MSYTRNLCYAQRKCNFPPTFFTPNALELNNLVNQFPDSIDWVPDILINMIVFCVNDLKINVCRLS